MSGVLSCLRPHWTSGVAVTSASASASSSSSASAAANAAAAQSAALAAEMLANPEDYAIPAWALKVAEWAKAFRAKTPEGAAMRRQVTIAALAAIAAVVVYKKYKQRSKKRRTVDVNAAKNASGVTTPSPSPRSLGDRLLHAPSPDGLLPVPSKSAGEREASKGGAAGDPSSKSKHKVAVDAIFFRRLWRILQIVIPSIYSKEMAYIVILTILLFARTFFSIYIAELIGGNAQALVSRKWGKMWRGIKTFAVVTIPASAVNSGLKYYTEMVSLRFRKRLSEYVHDEYLEGVNFYKACNLGGSERIDNADQRVTADIKDFSDEIAQLYASLLKPLLDVILFTYRLTMILGWQGPALMHSYFVLSGFIKKKIMPNLGRLVARESELEGFYRTAHNRLITNSEEIAFYDGSRKEKVIINNALMLIYKHVAYTRYVRQLVGVFDGLLVKYYASIAGYCTLLAPFIFSKDGAKGLSTAELTKDYIRNSQYLGQLSTAVGQLVMVGNKLTSIAGYTSRVSELLEQVRHLNEAGNLPFEIKVEPDHPRLAPAVAAADASSSAAGASYSEAMDKVITDWKERCDTQQALRFEIRHSQAGGVQPQKHSVVGGGEYRMGENISFEHVDIVSPEGKLLVKDLNFEVKRGTNVMVTGPNGVGKSSLFRIIGELWPLHSGVLTKPAKEEILFVPQKPYLVLGTLRDQVIYPHSHADMKKLGVTDEDLDALLAIVDPARNITTEWTWDTVKDWFHAFSGGQKQRIAMCRLFYHRPAFAILDECTSAVSDEVEGIIYETCRRMGITIFTVSHRPTLAKYHDIILRFEGNTRWSTKMIDSRAEIERDRREKALVRDASNAKLSTATSSSTSSSSSTQSNDVNANSGNAQVEEAQDDEEEDESQDSQQQQQQHHGKKKKKHGKRG